LNNNQRADAFDVIKSTDPEEFLELLRNKKPQLVFLDIDMGWTNGIRLGEKIKALYEDTVLVYITAYEKYALEAFGVRAFHYLLKPLTREKFNEVLEECVRHIEKVESVEAVKTLTIRTKKEIVCLNFDDIIYFEKIGHRIKLHTRERIFYYYDNFANLLDVLDPGSFLQCHQGYIANVSMVRGFRDKILFLEGEISLPVSRSYTDAVKNMLAERLFAGKDDR
jgi:DNA-binding LytR/AlgR family response regulator